MLTITIAADDTMLLTIEQLRASAGLAADDATQDASLEIIGARISAEICSACAVEVGNGGDPTLRRETVSETFRRRGQGGPLFLSRRHQIEITTITDEGGAVVSSDNYDVNSESGMIDNISGCWPSATYTVVYEAGFDDVPADLTGVAFDLARIRLSEQGRDPLVKATDVTVPDVEEISTQFWVGAIPSAGVRPTGLPSDLMARLKRYINMSV